MTDNDVVGVTEIAALLRVSRDTVYRHAQTGQIPGFRVGRTWRFIPSQVLDRLQQPVDPWAMSPASRRAKRVA